MRKVTKAEIEAEMRRFDEMTLETYLQKTGFKKPTKYWVQSKKFPKRGPYPAKAICGNALGLSKNDFSGGYSTAGKDRCCDRLEQAGFIVMKKTNGGFSPVKGRNPKIEERITAAEIVADYKKRLKKMKRTEIERLGKARIGQDIFRKALLKIWGECPFTKISDERLLRASHIKPWSKCATDEERLDPDNGLLLSALWDAAFDAGLVTFSDEGKVEASSKLGAQAKIVLQFDRATRLTLTEGHKAKLKWHRSKRFQK